MDANILYGILLDQRDEVETLVEANYVQRREASRFDFNSKLAQVVIGVRRSGKSTMCHMALQSRGLQYAYVNFDDDRLASLKVEDLNGVLEAIYRIYGTDIKYLFFDEIQNVEGWHLFVNRLLRMKLHVVVTGSNAKLLSSELATHLTGRYNEIRLFPFSFYEYCMASDMAVDEPTTKNVSLQKNALHDYLLSGGFPELDGIANKHAYVEGIVNAILTKDIKTRFKLRNADGLKKLANHLINNVGQLINFRYLSESMGVGTEKTVRKYLDYLSQAFLVMPLNKFSYKSRERMRDDKAYIIDTGLMTYRHMAPAGDNLGWRLENVVFIELLRRTDPSFQDLYYYRPTSRSKKVDFVVANRGQAVELIQVSLDISEPKTLRRELDALVEASVALRCDNLKLVAMTQTRTEERAGKTIQIVAANEWLLEVRRPESV